MLPLMSEFIAPTRRALPLADPHVLGPRLIKQHGQDGLAVAVYAPEAQDVALCLLNDTGEERIALQGPVAGNWHGFIPGVGTDQAYGFRAWGPWDPGQGLRFNPAKLLLDPYGRGIGGEFRLSPEIFSHQVDDALNPAGGQIEPDMRDSAPYVPHSVVATADFTNRAPKPNIAWRDTVIYEAHVRGLTKTLPDLPPELRGTYAGVAHPATIEHLKSLGVTAIELLPIHANIPEVHLAQRGMRNYWGYNTVGFFAPEPWLATRSAQEAGASAILAEVKGMVDLLHEAGIEVLLDVVYNHTAEAGTNGPTYSWRGLGARDYYLHNAENPGEFADVTGCGNTLDHAKFAVVRQTLDSLRYWATEIGVDGFRYDLGVALGRGPGGFDPNHPFFVALRSDPQLAGLKHIAEPWDLGFDGWRTGQFPLPFAEWNDRFRGATRTFWLSDPRSEAAAQPSSGVRDLATRLAGSADMFSGGEIPGARGPVASINFVTAHDGFTLADLTAYHHKHNEANGENNRDGTDDNRSWNHGVEGPVSASGAFIEIAEVRQRSMRNMLATTLLAAGTPMLTAGDEIGRTQLGNNNAYCQDELSWLDWDLGPWRRDLLQTTRYLAQLRRQYEVFRPAHFYQGQIDPEGPQSDVHDVQWFNADGVELDHGMWHDPRLRTLQMLRAAPAVTNGARAGNGDGCERGDLITQPGALLIFHGGLNTQQITPATPDGFRAELVWDSSWPAPEMVLDPELSDEAGEIVTEALSMLIYLIYPA